MPPAGRAASGRKFHLRAAGIGAFNPGRNDSLTPDFDFEWVADGACRSHLEPHMQAPDYYRASLDTSTQTLEVNVFHDAACTSALGPSAIPSRCAATSECRSVGQRLQRECVGVVAWGRGRDSSGLERWIELD